MTKTEEACRAAYKARFISASPEDIEISWIFMRPEVCAVLEALRTPTEAMIEAEGRARYDDWDEWPASFKSDFRAGILIGWNASITAALGETP